MNPNPQLNNCSCMGQKKFYLGKYLTIDNLSFYDPSCPFSPIQPFSLPSPAFPAVASVPPVRSRPLPLPPPSAPVRSCPLLSALSPCSQLGRGPRPFPSYIITDHFFSLASCAPSPKSGSESLSLPIGQRHCTDSWGPWEASFEL